MFNLDALEQQMVAWRHDLHANPEFGFEKSRTAAFVAKTLRGYGLDVVEGIGGTGVVVTLSLGSSNRAIALRADMDALRKGDTGVGQIPPSARSTRFSRHRGGGRILSRRRGRPQGVNNN